MAMKLLYPTALSDQGKSEGDIFFLLAGPLAVQGRFKDKVIAKYTNNL
jgi:hypothetical protein